MTAREAWNVAYDSAIDSGMGDAEAQAYADDAAVEWQSAAIDNAEMLAEMLIGGVI